MGYMIEISESKVEKMSEYVEDMLWAGGELMHCLEKMKGESGYGERGGMNYREHEEYGRYGKHSGGMNERYPYMGMRDDEDYEDEMNERRGGRRRRSNGRYY
jgi:hypothetical protein